MELRKDNRPILSFAKLKSVMPMPNLLDVQLRSFEKLIETDPEEQWDFGLEVIKGMGYELEAKLVMECLDRGLIESPVLPLSRSRELMEIMDAVRKDAGIIFPKHD